MNNSGKKYFVFISYSHKDIDWAKWIQHEFEYYILPDSLNKRTDLPSFRPVFRDEDELAGGDLTPQIIEALKDSSYLVVICSPNAVESPYVNGEIRNFLTIGKERNEDYSHKIFPLIVSGKPHAKDSDTAQECFPEALRTLTDFNGNTVELIAGDINATGRGKAFIKILAGILREKDVEFSQLWDRYENNKLEEEKKRREEQDKLYSMQSRFLSEKSIDLTKSGNSYLARKVALYALPKDLQDIEDRPYTFEAERALRIAYRHMSGKIRISDSYPLYFNDDDILTIGSCQIDLRNGCISTKDISRCNKDICQSINESGYKIDKLVLDSNHYAYFSHFDKSEIVKWDLRRNKIIKTYPTSNIRKHSLQMTSDSSLLVFGSIEEVIIWETVSDKQVLKIPSRCKNLIIDNINETIYWQEPNCIRRFDLKSMKLSCFNINEVKFNSYTLSSDFKNLAILTADENEFIIYNIESERVDRNLKLDFQVKAYRLDQHLLSLIIKTDEGERINIFDVNRNRIIYQRTEQVHIRQFAVNPKSNWLIWVTDVLKFIRLSSAPYSLLSSIKFKNEAIKVLDFANEDNLITFLSSHSIFTIDKDTFITLSHNPYQPYLINYPYTRFIRKDGNIGIVSEKILCIIREGELKHINIDYYKRMSLDISPEFNLLSTLYGCELSLYDIDTNSCSRVDIYNNTPIIKTDDWHGEQECGVWISNDNLLIIHSYGISKWQISLKGSALSCSFCDFIKFKSNVVLSLCSGPIFLQPIFNKESNEIYVVENYRYIRTISTDTLQIKGYVHDNWDSSNILHTELSPNGSYLLCAGRKDHGIMNDGNGFIFLDTIFLIETKHLRTIDCLSLDEEFSIVHFNEKGDKVLIFNRNGEFLSYDFPPLQDLIDEETSRFKDCQMTDNEKLNLYLI